jgi:hypothetical protein
MQVLTTAPHPSPQVIADVDAATQRVAKELRWELRRLVDCMLIASLIASLIAC